MAIDMGVPRTRRALLAGGVGGIAAAAAAALGRPLAAAAAEPYVGLGQANTATKTTLVEILTTTQAALKGKGTSGDGVVGESAGPSKSGVYGVTTESQGYGVFGRNWASLNTGYLGGGYAGVLGEGTDGYGVYGFSSISHGVQGVSQSAVGVVGNGPTYGVAGYDMAAPGAGTFGISIASSTGAFGWSCTKEDGTIPALPAKTGVYGYAAQDAKSVGVRGASPPGTGMYGTSSSGIGVRGGSTSSFGVHGTSSTSDGVNGYSGSGNGVYGRSPGGHGVHGTATSGTGVYATATTGYALRAVGRVKLDKCAGVATIASGASSKTVTPGIDLVPTSAVVATLNGNAGGSTTVKRVTVNPTANTFTIHLTANATQNVKVAWHVFG